MPGLFDAVSGGFNKIKFWRSTKSVKVKQYEENNTKRPGPPHKLQPFQQFIMTLIRLRLDLPLLLIADLFDVSTSTVSDITVTWISYLYQTVVPVLLTWPSQQQVNSRMPLAFREFPSARVIIDCTEFLCATPTNKQEQYRTYSQYKHHNTYKALVGINPLGAFTFVSDLWSGNVSDRYITQESGLIEKLEDGDQVLADRGFQIEDLLLVKGATLVAPPFTRKCGNNAKGKRLNVSEIRKTRKIANVRIHVERAIARLKGNTTYFQCCLEM